MKQEKLDGDAAKKGGSDEAVDKVCTGCEKAVSRLETERFLMFRTNEELFCVLQATTRANQTTD